MTFRARTFLTLFVAALAVSVAMPAGASAVKYGKRTIKPGMKGGDVKTLQRYLRRAGHKIRADGAFGPTSQRALALVESDLELRVDGKATRREQKAIKNVLSNPTTGGATYIAPPPLDKVVPGAKGTVNAQGYAIPPASAPQVVKDVIAAGNKIAKTPYKWGGGHGSWNDTGYDCSGSVSYALHGAGLLNSPLVSGDFPAWGRPGRGSWITVWGNGGHVYMYVAGMRFDTSARKTGGSRWTMQARSNSSFEASHPKKGL
jgi:cell wall-associated NlpC family hydrolase